MQKIKKKKRKEEEKRKPKPSENSTLGDRAAWKHLEMNPDRAAPSLKP